MTSEACAVEVCLNLLGALSIEYDDAPEEPVLSKEIGTQLIEKYAEKFPSLLEGLSFLKGAEKVEYFFGLDQYGSGLGTYLEGSDDSSEIAILGKDKQKVIDASPWNEDDDPTFLVCVKFVKSDSGPDFEGMADELCSLSAEVEGLVRAWYFKDDDCVVGQGWDNGDMDSGYLQALENDEDIEEYCINDIETAQKRLALIE